MVFPVSPWAALLVALVVSGCGNGSSSQGLRPARRQHVAQPGQRLSLLEKSNNEFAIASLRELADAQPKSNVVFSPWSVGECLGMIRIGAKGASSNQIGAFLHQRMTPERAAADFQLAHELFQPLASAGILKSANGIWIQNSFAVNSSYSANVSKHFGAQVHSVDMPEPALSEINQFVSKETDGQIPKVFDSISNQDQIVLVNAIAFRDSWATPFDRNLTKPSPFYCGDRVKRTAMMMSDSDGKFVYFEDRRMQAIRLAYASGLAMEIFLPKRGVSVQSILNRKDLTNLAYSFDREGNVKIPRWKSDFSWDVRKAMARANVMAPFEPSSDFSPISSEQLQITNISHRATVVVDEVGTAAAAATGAEVLSLEASPKDKRISFVANHPFVFLIRLPGSIVLFAGVVNNPTQV